MTTKLMRPAALVSAFFLVFALMATVPARADIEIQEVKSDKGVTAWLVEDYSVPIVTLRFAFEGGATQDPEGKAGLANLMSGLFDEGAGELDSDAFQERLDDVGAEMSFNVTRDALYGSMRMLADSKDEAFDLLRLAVNAPRFDEAPVERIRAQIVSGIKSRQRDPDQIAEIAWNDAIYGDHPYARQTEGTVETVSPLGSEDLKALHKALFARGNLHVGVVGAIDADSLKIVLDKLFGDLPEKPQLREIAKVTPKLGREIGVSFDQPQTSIRLAYPGLDRKAPEFFAAYLMNHILGGGTFSSRLFEEVREKRGLAYGVGSYLISNAYSNVLMISTATRSDRADQTLGVIRDEVAKMAADGPTQQELDDAKRYVIGAYAINNLDSSSDIASVLVNLQIEDLGIDYINTREADINAVTLDQVKAEAARLLSAEPAILLVGPETEVGKDG